MEATFGYERRGDVMTEENGDEAPVPATIEYHDRRRRAKQQILTARYAESNNFDPFKPHGKPRQIQYKVSEFVWETGEKVAALYGLSLSQYSKALLYQNLAIFESTDRRRKKRV